MKVHCEAFVCFQFGFVFFWQKEIGGKAAHKMLVKLTQGRKKRAAHVKYKIMLIKREILIVIKQRSLVIGGNMCSSLLKT